MNAFFSHLFHDAELPSWKPLLELGHNVVGLDLGELESDGRIKHGRPCTGSSKIIWQS